MIFEKTETVEKHLFKSKNILFTRHGPASLAFTPISNITYKRYYFYGNHLHKLGCLKICRLPMINPVPSCFTKGWKLERSNFRNM